jgi:hypothetical protein
MREQSHSGANGRLNVTILYEGVVVGQGQVRPIDAHRAFVEIQDFPLGANSFLELIIDSEDNMQVSTPVRVLRNTGEGLEVEIDSVDPGIRAEIVRDEH